MKLKLEELVFDFSMRDDEELLATMIMDIGQFKIRGFQVRPSKYGDFVLYPPSNRAKNNNWIHIFWTPDKNEWKNFERLVLEKFRVEYESFLRDLNKSSTSDDEIDVSNINF